MLAGVIYLVFFVRYLVSVDSLVSVDRLQTKIEKRKGTD